MTYFNPASHFMAMSVAPKIDFLGLENFKMLHISSSVPLHANRFDVQHDLLWHLCTSSPCPWPPRSTSCGWRTLTCCTLHLLWIFMTIVLMCYMTYFNTAFHFMSVSVATKINFLWVENSKQISWGWRSLNNVHYICFAFLCWSFWCAACPTSTLQCTSCPCPWPPWSTSWARKAWHCWKPSHVYSWCVWRTTHAFSNT